MKKKRTRKHTGGIMAATTTSRDWGHGPVAGKGGRTTNYESKATQEKPSKE